MDSIKLPTFTIATSKCCSLILPFADIAQALSNEPHIVQVGIGELAKNYYQIEKLGINWLHAPKNWPVFVSGFNPGIHPHNEQIFQYDLAKKKIQVTSGNARESLTHSEMVEMVRLAKNPQVDIVCLPCEQGTEMVIPAPPPEKKPRHEGVSKKLKRKANRRHQSFLDSMEALKGLDKTIICPLTMNDPDLNLVAPPDVSVSGYSGTVPQSKPLPGIRFVQVHDCESNEATLVGIKKILTCKSADVIETDLPFKLAREGVLLNSNFELTDMKSKNNFNDHSELLVIKENDDKVPANVREAAAHMKSYIHHLFRCDELSGPILLATVNLFQIEKMFHCL